MLTKYVRAVVVFLLVPLASPNYLLAEEPVVVPSAEKEIAQQLDVDGPKETHGIKRSELLGSVGLEDDFPALQGRSLRVRRVTVEPGGVVGVHQHTRRPGVLYMLEGQLVEVRNDSNSSIERSAGDVSFEKGGVIHWWRNDSGADAKALVVDIVPESFD